MITSQKRGIILLNLGGPESLRAVRPFLYNLFSDRQIIRLGPSILQKPLALFISAMRAPKTRAMYERIGGGSPILAITQAQARALADVLGPEGPSVYVGMRYWHPFIEEAVAQAVDEGVTELVGLNLYPHESLATSGSSCAALEGVLSAHPGLRVHCIKSWPDQPSYIAALIELITEGLEGLHGKCRDILFSAHGLPEYFITRGDPYVRDIERTIHALRGGLPWDVAVHLSYQSRSGPVKWLSPSTEERIDELAQKGVKELLVVPISFVSDHIETLYEIDILYTELARSHGMDLKRVKALNTHPLFIRALQELAEEAFG